MHVAKHAYFAVSVSLSCLSMFSPCSCSCPNGPGTHHHTQQHRDAANPSGLADAVAAARKKTARTSGVYALGGVYVFGGVYVVFSVFFVYTTVCVFGGVYTVFFV